MQWLWIPKKQNYGCTEEPNLSCPRTAVANIVFMISRCWMSRYRIELNWLPRIKEKVFGFKNELLFHLHLCKTWISLYAVDSTQTRAFHQRILLSLGFKSAHFCCFALFQEVTAWSRQFYLVLWEVWPVACRGERTMGDTQDDGGIWMNFLLSCEFSL